MAKLKLPGFSFYQAVKRHATELEEYRMAVRKKAREVRPEDVARFTRALTGNDKEKPN